MRTLPPATTTEKNRQTGASFIRILEINWGAGPVYYSDVPRTAPVVCQGRVLAWGPLNLQAEPGRVGGHQQAQIELQDADHTILALMSANAVAKRTVRIHLWFTNTTWPDDRVTLFAGTINGRIGYNDTAATWSFGVKGAESLYDKTLGIEINRKSFPATLCNECSGKIIPVVYGANVRRIPCCPLGRPARSYLIQDLGILADVLQISRSVVDMGLEYDTPYTLRIGTKSSYENILVAFEESLQVSGAAGDTDGVAIGTIISRGSTLASGLTSPLYGSGGLAYMVIPESALPDPDKDLRGFVILVETPQGWQSFVISEWIDIGNGRAVVPQSDEIDFAEGQPWKILTTVGQIPVWPVGTEVTIGGEYKFAVSHTPLESVDILEVKGTVNNGGQSVRYFELAPEDYAVELDDRSFNESLDRGPADPGITTVTINFSPRDFGSENDVIYITGSHELTDPVDILTDILRSEWLGNIDPDDYPIDSTGAASDVTPAFALTEPFKLHDTVSDLAQQCGLLLFWDGGKICLRSVKSWDALGTPAFTASNANIAAGSFSLTFEDGPAEVNRLVAVWKPSVSGQKEFRYTREAPAAIELYGEKTKEMKFWALQNKQDVATMATFWLAYWLGAQREVRFTTFLNALQVQPGDTVSVNYRRADNNAAIVNSSCLVTQVNHTPADAQGQQMETVEITALLRSQVFSIEAVPDEDECAVTPGSEDDEGLVGEDSRGDQADIGNPPSLGLGPDPTGPFVYPNMSNGYPGVGNGPGGGGGYPGSGGAGGSGGGKTKPLMVVTHVECGPDGLIVDTEEITVPGTEGGSSA